MDDFSILNDFYCGVKEFDEFIHSGEFEENVILKLSVPYSVKENGELVAFFSLACDSLLLEDDYKEDFSDEKAILDDSFGEHVKKFMSKQYYPALDISYLCVKKDLRQKHYGKAIIERILDFAVDASEKIGLLFLVVDAFHDSVNQYSTVNFYAKCGFVKCSELKGNTIRMYKTIF
ncbi:MAG: GNAT family N-acetyltransferase [Bacteroidales bacterium]|nr:GNAT family N-acetyltransferase [Bacteroidales bacterium]